MKPDETQTPLEVNEEVSALIETLNRTGRRLEELTAGQVDTVVDSDGRTLLLRGTQEQLRQRENARQASILNALPAHVALLDANGIILSVNDQWRRFAAANTIQGTETSVGLNYLETCDNAQGDGSSEARQVAEGIRSVLTGNKQTFSMEYPCHSPTEQRWFLLRAIPLDVDRLNGAVVMHLNITDQKIAKDELRESDRRFRDMLGNVELISIMLDRKARVTYCNDYLLRLTGREREEVIGQDWFELFIPPDENRTMAAFSAILAGLSSATHHENEILTCSGDLRRIRWNNTVLRSASGEAIGVASVGDDITERKQHEDSLSRLAAIVDSSYDAIASLTPAGIIVSWNQGAERIYGYSAEEIVGQSVLILCAPSQDVELSNLLKRVSSGKEAEQFESVRTKKNGTLIHVAITLSPIMNSDGCVIGVSSVGRDITESRLMEERFRKSQKMEAVGLLAGGIAHDFNNLLTVIIGYSEVLLEQRGLNERMLTHCSEIKRAGDRAASLTRQLLAFSRQQVLAPRALNLNAVVVDTEKMLRRLIGEDIELRTTLNPALGLVMADPGQIEQIILNLVVNARDALPQGGKVVIETSNVELDDMYAFSHQPLRAGLYTLLAVSDDGIGMDDETKGHIFEPFFTTKEVGKGTGLGLSTVYGVVKQSGGYVWAYSELGHGTVFKIYLPRVDELIQVSRPIDSASEVFCGTETVLLAEDEESVRLLTRSFLEEHGYTVLVASSGTDAIEVAEKHSGPIHLLLTDLVMPGMNGRALAQKMIATRPTIRVVYISGYTGSLSSLGELLDAGAMLVQKPFSRSTLLGKLREVLDFQTESETIFRS